MKIHELRVWPSTERHPREDELAWQLAELAIDPVPVDADVIEMLANRIIDNASVAIASLERPSVAHARQQAGAFAGRRCDTSDCRRSAGCRRNGHPGRTARPSVN